MLCPVRTLALEGEIVAASELILDELEQPGKKDKISRASTTTGEFVIRVLFIARMEVSFRETLTQRKHICCENLEKHLVLYLSPVEDLSELVVSIVRSRRRVNPSGICIFPTHYSPGKRRYYNNESEGRHWSKNRGTS